MSDAARDRATGIAAAAGLVAAVTLASRVVGFARWLVFSGTVGGTCVGETYATANQLPNVLFEVAAGGALAAVVIPLVGRALARQDRAEADRIASALLTWALAVLLPLGVLLALLAVPLTGALLGDGGTCESAARDDLAVRMLLVFAPQVPLYAVAIVLAGVLQAHKRFLAAALAPLLSSLVVIAGYVAYGVLDGSAAGDPARLPGAAELALSGGTTLGVVALSLPLLIPVRRAGIRLRPTLRFPAGTARRAGRLAGAGMLALAAQQVAVVATLWVTNHWGDRGAVNVYTYVQTVYLLPYAVLAVPLATVAFPSLVGAHDGDDAPAAVLTRGLRGVLAAGALGAAVLLAAAPAVGAFFTALDVSHGSAAGSSLPAMAGALTAYAPGLLGFAVAALLQRAAYARGATWAAGAAVAAGWLVAAVVPLVLVREPVGSARALEVLGWSSTAGMTLSALLLLVVVSRVWGAGAVTAAGRTAVAALLAAVAAALLGRAFAERVGGEGLWAAVGSGLVAGGVTVVVFAAIALRADPGLARLLRGRVSRDSSP